MLSKAHDYACPNSKSTQPGILLGKPVAGSLTLIASLLLANPALALDIGGFFEKLDQGIKSALGSSEGANQEEPGAPKSTEPAASRNQTDAPSPNTTAAYGLTREQHRVIQQRLALLGYQPGPADGLPGAKTRAAIQAFQQDQGFAVDGLPSVTLIDQLEEAKDKLPEPKPASPSKEIVHKPTGGTKQRLHRSGGMEFLLPPGATAAQTSECNRDMVGQIARAKIEDVRQWRCLGYVKQGSSKITLLKNREKPSRSYGVPSWLFKAVKVSANGKATNLGDVRAKDGLVPVINAQGNLEILGLTKAGWSGNPSDPPYARYAVASRLKRLSEGPKVATLFDTAKPGNAGGGSTRISGNPAGKNYGPSNLSDEFYTNKMAAIAKYSAWKSAPFTFQSVSFSNSSFIVEQVELPTSFERAHDRRMAQMNQGKDYWKNWIDMSSGQNPMSQRWTLTCLFPASEGTKMANITEGSTNTVQLKIKDAQDRRLVFDCKL